MTLSELSEVNAEWNKYTRLTVIITGGMVDWMELQYAIKKYGDHKIQCFTNHQVFLYPEIIYSVYIEQISAYKLYSQKGDLRKTLVYRQTLDECCDYAEKNGYQLVERSKIKED